MKQVRKVIDFSRDYWEFAKRTISLEELAFFFLGVLAIAVVGMMVVSTILGLIQVFGPPIINDLLGYRPPPFP